LRTSSTFSSYFTQPSSSINAKLELIGEGITSEGHSLGTARWRDLYRVQGTYIGCESVKMLRLGPGMPSSSIYISPKTAPIDVSGRLLQFCA
jgi:hypothetical protein